jgi:hypothetical protein
MAGLLVGAPLVLSDYMELSLQDRHLAIGDLRHQVNRNMQPPRVSLISLVQAHCGSGAAISLNHSPIGTDVDGLDQPPIVAD